MVERESGEKDREGERSGVWGLEVCLGGACLYRVALGYWGAMYDQHMSVYIVNCLYLRVWLSVVWPGRYMSVS